MEPLKTRLRSYISGIKKQYDYKNDLKVFLKLNSLSRFGGKMDRYPCLNDKTSTTGFDPHYIYHPAWAARKLRELGPEKHVDISSTLHFCSIVSAFLPVDFYDFRPAALTLSGMKSQAADLTNLFFADNSIPSLSCMHVVEHIGLGRYGDPIDPDGDLKAIKELKRVTARGGSLLFVTPVGQPRVQFNAHRIYGFEQIMEYFQGFQLREFSMVADNAVFISNADPAIVRSQKYSCGCFWFIKE